MLPTSAPSTKTVSGPGIACAFRLELDAVVSWSQRAVGGFAPTTTLTLNGPLLHRDARRAVDGWMLSPGWVYLQPLVRDCSLPSIVEGDHRVGFLSAVARGEIVGVNFEVLLISAVAVKDGGHPAAAPGATRRALPVLGAYLRVRLFRVGSLAILVLRLLPVRCFGTARVANHQMSRAPFDTVAEHPRRDARPGYRVSGSSVDLVSVSCSYSSTVPSLWGRGPSGCRGRPVPSGRASRISATKVLPGSPGPA